MRIHRRAEKLVSSGAATETIFVRTSTERVEENAERRRLAGVRTFN